MKNQPQHRHQPRHGAALLDVISASVLVALLIVPSVRLTIQAQENSRRLELRNELSVRCASLLEEEIAAVQRSFRSRTRQRRIRYDGTDFRCVIRSSDAANNGGVPSRIMCISVLLWHDENRNGTLDISEQSAFLLTRITAPTVSAQVVRRAAELKPGLACNNDEDGANRC